MNNVETLAAACLIAVHGGAWYAQHGTEKSTGTKLLSVSGDCERPGIYEYPYGVSVRQVLDDCGATDSQAVQISGPSGICVAAEEFDRRIAFEDLPTAGAFMIFDDTRDMFEVARNFAHFFAHESCGFCTPCRVGTTLVTQPDGQDREEPRLALRHQRTVQAAPPDAGRQPLRSGQQRLQPGVRHAEQVPPGLRTPPASRSTTSRPSISTRRCREARQMTGRDDAGAHLAVDTMARHDSIMSDTATPSSLDGEDIPFTPGQTIMQAAKAAGMYIPHLCWHPGLQRRTARARSAPSRSMAASVPVAPWKPQAGMNVENRTAELDDKRRTLLQMFFVEGNHFCPSCEKSGDCAAAGHGLRAEA